MVIKLTMLIQSSRLKKRFAISLSPLLIISVFILQDNSSGSLVGIIVGVVVGVLAAGGVVTSVLVWKKKRGDAGVVTMSKILEDSEARGSILEEAEVTMTSSL